MTETLRRATLDRKRLMEARGMVRLELRANPSDVPFIRAITKILRRGGAEAETLREQLRDLVPPRKTPLHEALMAIAPSETDDVEFGRDNDTTRDFA